jgi:TonB-dependent receptor
MRTPPRRNCLAIALASSLGLLIAGSHLHAQPAPAEAAQLNVAGPAGQVSGQVKESARGVYLGGAVVRVNGAETTTDREGRFRLSGLSAGSYTLEVDFLGYEPLRTTIELGASNGIEAVVTLTSTVADRTLDAIEVRATRDAQALALNQQRASGNYVNIVSADLVGRFPDANLAEATQRIPGVSIERDQGEGRYVNVRGAPLDYTRVSIDGVNLAAPNATSRAVELDTLPSDVIGALEVSKALTPDMDGDAIAGAINIVTQSALDQDGMILRGSLGAGQYELRSGDNQRGNLTVGNRFGADGNLGVLLAVSGSRVERFTNNVENVFFREDDGRLLPEVTEVKDYDGERTRTGGTARFDARLSEDHLLYAILGFSKFRDVEFRNTFTIEYERHTDDSDDFAGTAGRATFDKELRERIQEQRIRSLNFGGEHYLGDWGVDWQVAHSQGKLDLPARQQFIYRSTLRPVVRYAFDDSGIPSITILNSDGSVRQEGINLPEDVYAFRRYNQRFEQAEETETGLRLDFSRAQDWIGDSGDLSFGVRARLRDKEGNDDRNRNTSSADGPAYAQLLCPRVSNNFGRLEFGRVFCNSVFNDFGSNVRTANLRPLVADSIVSDFTADEDIYAAYFRLDASWNALSMIAGVRFEQTDITGNAFSFDADEDIATPVTADNDYSEFLPSLHFRYEFDPDTIMRWSYSTALSRPNFVDTVPRLVISDDDREAEAGNPDLKATYAHNFDVSIERYLRPLGLLSLAVFHKELDDPIFIASSEAVGGPFDGFKVTRPENGSSGRISGFELAWQQTFDALPSPFDGLGVYANYTYADSSANLPFGIGSTELPGTSRSNYNLAVFYEKYGVNARLSYNHRSKYIQEFDVDDADLNVLWDDRSILDFSSSYQLTNNLRLFADVNNITDSRQKRFQGRENRVLELEEFGRSWIVGLRFEY